MDDVDDTDVHYCIRCNAHIEGLENYIRHRKTACNKQRDAQPSQPDKLSSRQATISKPALQQQSMIQTTSLETLPVQPSSHSATSLPRSIPPVSGTQVSINFVEGYDDSCEQVKEHLCEVDENKETGNGANTPDGSVKVNVTEPKEHTENMTGNTAEKGMKKLSEGGNHANEPDGDVTVDVPEPKDHTENMTGNTAEKGMKKLPEGGVTTQVGIESENDIEEAPANASCVSSSTNQLTDENYDYSRYVEDKLLGNINTTYREARLNKKLQMTTRVILSKMSKDIAYKEEDVEYSFHETRKRKYRKKNSKNVDLNQGISDDMSDTEEDVEKKKKKTVKEKKNLIKSDSSAPVKKKSTSKTWSCPVCNKVMRAHSQAMHMRIHSNHKPFKCHLCTYASKTQSDMKIHIKRHLGIKEFKCTECEYATTKKSLLTKHFHRHQREKGLEDYQYQCDECGKRYCTNEGLKLHIRAVHENIKPFICNFENCRYAGVSNSELEIHKRTHTKEKPFLCTQCGYKAGNKNRLRRHMITHTDETPFKCDYPGCTFVGKTAFRVRRHKKQHDPANRLFCPYCSYTTFYLGNLRKHIKNTAKHKDTKVYLCEICKTFNTDSYKALIDHYDDVHKGDVNVTVHSGGLKLGQFNQARQQDEDTEETILILPEEAIVIADNVEFTL